MLAIKKAGMAPGKLAPKEITENLENKVGMYDRLPKPTFEASWAMLHLGYGSTSEVVYVLTQEGAPGLERRGLVGPLFGMLLWTIDYCGRPPASGYIRHRLAYPSEDRSRAPNDTLNPRNGDRGDVPHPSGQQVRA